MSKNNNYETLSDNVDEFESARENVDDNNFDENQLKQEEENENQVEEKQLSKFAKIRGAILRQWFPIGIYRFFF